MNEIPEVLGRCKLKQRLGEGAMGVVYLADHTTLQISVAVKVLSTRMVEFSAGGAQRFVQEARIAARLNHPNIVRVYDCGRQGELYYIVMDYIAGETCRQRLDRGERFEWKEAVRIIAAVASGLEAASQQGVIHRDVKPDNIMIDSKGVPRITDLGVAKLMMDSAASQTAAESILGTPYYISPEQARDPRSVDFRSDIYSLGGTLFHMVFGKPPFDAHSIYEVVNKHVKEPVIFPRSEVPDVPAALCDVIAKMMAKDPEDRYQSYGELLADLGRALCGEQVAAVGAELRLQRHAILQARDLAELRGGRVLQPSEVPASPLVWAGTVVACVSLLGMALAALVLFHTLRAVLHPGVAWTFAAVVAVAYLAHTLFILRPIGERVQPDEKDRAKSRIASLLQMLAAGLQVPEPALYIVPGRQVWCRSFGLVRKWVVAAPHGVLYRLDATNKETAAMLAQETGRFYYGCSTLLSLLDAPLRLILCVLKPVDAPLRWAAGARDLKRRLVGHLGAFVALAVLAAVLWWLCTLWFWCGAAVAAFVLFSLLGRSVRRYSDYAVDKFAAAVVGDAEPVQTLLARQAVATAREHWPMLRQADVEIVRQRGAGTDEAQGPRPAHVGQVVFYFSKNLWRGGAAGWLCELWTGRPSPARRLNALSGLTARPPALARYVGRLLGLHAGVIGARDVQSRLFLPAPQRIGAQAGLGLIAGLFVAAGALAPLGGGPRLASLLFIACLLAAFLGWQAGTVFCHRGGAREELSVWITLAVFGLTVSHVIVAGTVRVAALGQAPLVFILALLAASGGAVLALRVGTRAAGADSREG